MTTVLVTGATGTVGKHVVTALSERPGAMRVGLRDPAAALSRLGDAEAAAFDFEKPETWGPALADVDGVFLMRPPTVDAATVAEFAEAAARVGVSQIAYLSTLGAERIAVSPHRRIEKRIVATEAGYTLLRASFFMQNLLEVHRADVVERDELFVPAGDGKTSFVDARDVGAVAATVLTEPGHENRAYDLTGPEALDFEAVATIFSRVLGRRITYPDPSLLAFARRMHRRGHPLGFLLVMCVIYTTTRLGLAARVTPDARAILGREPRDITTFVDDYADEFRPDGNPPASGVDND